jgi:hypothetical protein
VGYSIEGLRDAAVRQDGSAAAASSLADLLKAVTIDVAMLGGVPSAAGLVEAVVTARDTQVRAAGREAERRADLGRRATTTAETGQRLVDLTTAQAGAGGPVPFGNGASILGGG